MVSPCREVPRSSDSRSLPGSLAWLISFLILTIVLATVSGCGSQATLPKPIAPPLVQVAIVETSVNLGAGETHQFTATVAGTSNTAVTWSLSGCTGAACGSISATGLYAAPSQIDSEATITVTATSQADSTKFDTVAVHHKFIAVSIDPPGSAMLTPGETMHFNATVLYDIHDAGVNWAFGPTCGSSACGVLSDITRDSVTYTAPTSIPNPPTVALIATSISDAGRSAEMPITISAKTGLQEGDYAFLFNGWQLHFSGGYYTYSIVATAGHFHADAKGNITDGLEDVNLASGAPQAAPFTGSYTVGANRRGSFTLSTAQGTATYRMTVNSSGNKGKFIKYDGLPTNEPISGSGYFELQDKTAFALPALAGSYAVGMSGILQEWNRTAAAGRFTTDAAGGLSNGTMDAAVAKYAGTSPQTNYLDSTLTGSLDAPSPGTGRGTATLSVTPPLGGATGTLTFAYYIISSEKILLVQKDTRSSGVSVLSGEARRQSGTFSVAAAFDSPVVFSLTGVNRSNYGVVLLDAAIGQMVSNGPGNITGIIDQNEGGTVILDKAFTGSYLVDPRGRTTINLELGTGTTTTQVAYLFGPCDGFLLQTSGTDVLFGTMKRQSGGPFTAGSVSGTFLTNTGTPLAESARNYTGLTMFDGGNGASATLDSTNWEELHFDKLTGTYAVTGNGRGTLTFNGPPQIAFWVISPGELVGIATVDSSDFEPVLLEFEE